MIQLLKRSTYQPLLCCALLFSQWQLTHWGTSWRQFIICFTTCKTNDLLPVASFLFVVFNLANKSWFCLFKHFQTRFSRNCGRSRQTKPGSWGCHVMSLNKSHCQKSTASNEFAFLALNPPLYFYNWLRIQRISPYMDPITLYLRDSPLKWYQDFHGSYVDHCTVCFCKNANIPQISEKYADGNRQNIVK